MEAAERTRKRLHTVTCYHLSYHQWRDTDWFTTRVPDQTQKRPHFIQGVNKPSPSTLHQRTRTAQPHLHINGWAPRPMRNSKPQGISEDSRFSCMKFLGVSEVFDYAGPNGDSRYRLHSCCLPRITKTSASGLHLFGAESPRRLSSVCASLCPSR